MRRTTFKLILIALQVAAVATVFALQGDRDSHRGQDRGKGGYSHSQRGVRRDADSRERRASPRYEGSHNHFRDNGTRVSIGVVTPEVYARIGSDGTRVRFRSGYYHHDPEWRDDRFLFAGYLFDYDADDATFSPFYYYPQMPGYVARSEVDYDVGSVGFRFNRTVSWDERGDGGVDRDLEEAIEGLLDGVTQRDDRALSRIVPGDYRVEVSPGIGRPYSMLSDDFYDMLSDMARATDTVDYRVLHISVGRDCARVDLEHRFNDPWNHRVTSYHRVIFDDVDGDYRIARFETSRRRF